MMFTVFGLRNDFVFKVFSRRLVFEMMRYVYCLRCLQIVFFEIFEICSLFEVFEGCLV